MPAQPRPLSSCGQAISTDILHSIETTSLDILNATQAALKCQGFSIIPGKVRYIAIDKEAYMGNPGNILLEGFLRADPVAVKGIGEIKTEVKNK